MAFPPFLEAYVDQAKSCCHGEDLNPDNTVGKFQKIVGRQQTAIDKVVLGLEKLDMPKREFLYFDGDSLRNPRFIKSFDLNVESMIEDENVRLSNLIQNCIGKAKEAIENCVILPGAEGYKAARDILRRNFGQRHVIIRSPVDKVFKGPQLKSSDGEKISQLARDMQIYQLNFSEMRYEADINSMDTLTKIVVRLLVHMRAKWAEESGKLLKMGLQLSFVNLT